jgi:hypothetical protein
MSAMRPRVSTAASMNGSGLRTQKRAFHSYAGPRLPPRDRPCAVIAPGDSPVSAKWLVEPGGIEPPTSSMPLKRSPN